MTHAHQRRFALPFHWPSPPLQVVLVEPEIPQNTGNIARLCAATGTPLHLVGPLGFRLHDRAVRRAGLDYWEAVELHRHVNFDAYLGVRIPRGFTFSAPAARARISRRIIIQAMRWSSAAKPMACPTACSPPGRSACCRSRCTPNTCARSTWPTRWPLRCMRRCGKSTRCQNEPRKTRKSIMHLPGSHSQCPETHTPRPVPR